MHALNLYNDLSRIMIFFFFFVISISAIAPALLYLPHVHAFDFYDGLVQDCVT